MKVKLIWEHNGNDTLLYASDIPGAFSRGHSFETAIEKFPAELDGYRSWQEKSAIYGQYTFEIVQEKHSSLNICDADSDVLFDNERVLLTFDEYIQLKSLALRSAQDFQTLFDAIPDKNASVLPERDTFYGPVPRTATEMYVHTKNVNAYYFGEINVEADNDGNIFECRRHGFERLETNPDFLKNATLEGSYDELWTLRKVIRRFIWHDRIHAKAMYRMALRTFGQNSVPDIFSFGPSA